MEIISMTCRQCSGSLKISKDADQIICQHCGTEYLISFNEGAISVKLLSEGLKKIQVSTDKTASELALVRLKAERDLLMMKIRDEIKDALASAGFGQIPDKRQTALDNNSIHFQTNAAHTQGVPNAGLTV